MRILALTTSRYLFLNNIRQIKFLYLCRFSHLDQFKSLVYKETSEILARACADFSSYKCAIHSREIHFFIFQMVNQRINEKMDEIFQPLMNEVYQSSRDVTALVIDFQKFRQVR